MKPCTIKQLMDATNDGSDTFRVDGQEVTQVMLVGCVIEKVERSTNTSWIIEDGTGRMEVMMYQDDAGANPVAEERRAACMQNTMVRAVGNFREFQGKRNVLAFDVQPLKDFNEVTRHFLEAIYAHCVATRGPLPMEQPLGGQQPGGGGGGAGGMMSPGRPGAVGGGMGMGMGNGFQSPPGGGYQAAGGGGGGGAMGPAANGGGGAGTGNALGDKIREYAQANDSEMGIQRSHFINLFTQQGHSEKEINDSLEWLSSEGHLYSTIDEDHFKHT